MLVLTAAVTAAASSLLAGGSDARRGHDSAPTLTEIRAVPHAQAASFGILRRPLRSTDPFRGLHPGSGPFGANPALARTVSEPRGGLSAGLVSVVPANGWVCLRVPFAAGGAQWWCQTLALARTAKLVMALRPAGPLRDGAQLLIGLVPDGVGAVTVVTRTGLRRTIPVRSNVYDAQVDAPRSVSIDLPGIGIRRYRAP